MTVRDETAKTPSETGTRSREEGLGTDTLSRVPAWCLSPSEPGQAPAADDGASPQTVRPQSHPPSPGALGGAPFPVAERRACDLIVMGAHGGGLGAAFFGSTAQHVVRGASCPVVTVRSKTRKLDSASGF